jgi:hypothetical protein
LSNRLVTRSRNLQLISGLAHKLATLDAANLGSLKLVLSTLNSGQSELNILTLDQILVLLSVNLYGAVMDKHITSGLGSISNSYKAISGLIIEPLYTAGEFLCVNT